MTRWNRGRSERRRRHVLVLVASVLVATASGWASASEQAASEPTLSEPAKRHLVSVKIAGEPAAMAAVLDVLRERIGGDASDTSFEVVPAIDKESIVTPGPPNDEQLARIWIDLTEEGSPKAEGAEPRAEGEASEPFTLYVVDGAWERVLVRPVARQPNPEVTWEEMGHIVELALGALRAGESIGVGRAVAREQLLPTPPPLPPPASPPDERPPPPPPQQAERPVRLRGGAFYSATAYGSALELASGPGVMLELHAPVRPTLDVGGTLTGEYRLPSSVDRGDAEVRFEGAAVTAMASVSYGLAPRHELMFGAGGGVELVRARASTTLPNVRFDEGAFDPIPVTRLLARYGWSWSPLRVFGGIGMDVSLVRPRYLLSRGGEPVVLFEPWALRPFLLVGIETN